MNLEDYRQELMQDPETEAAYQKLRPRLDLGRQILDLRLQHGWTQKELANRAGTKQANISRLENALLNPSIKMLQKVANALGARLEIQLVPEEEESSLLQEPILGLEQQRDVFIRRESVAIREEPLHAMWQAGPESPTVIVSQLGAGAMPWIDYASEGVDVERVSQ